ncbi:hypothetical protein PFISCL1PPCAC_16555, partial [Pristionchus fissidentatus]
MRWTNEAPSSTGQSMTHSPLTAVDAATATLIAEQLAENDVLVVKMRPSVMRQRPMGAVVELLPEISVNFGNLTGTGLKTISHIDGRIQCWRPERVGMTIEGPGRVRSRPTPHLIFITDFELQKMKRFGTAIIMALVRTGPETTAIQELMTFVHALKKERMEKILLLTDGAV